MSKDLLQEQISVISEPNRFRIVGLLRTGPHSVGEIVTRLELGQPQVSRHLRILGDADVVQVTKQAQRRIYNLKPQPFAQIRQWLDSFADLWEARLDTLDDYLEEMEDQ